MKLRVSLINFSLEKNKENGLKRNSFQKKLLEKQCTNKLCESVIVVPERMKTTQFTKRHLKQLRLKLDSLKEAMNKN